MAGRGGRSDSVLLIHSALDAPGTPTRDKIDVCLQRAYGTPFA